jgi:ABC-type transport system involved in cytochrome c biogenesis ATPase subunit
MRGRIGWLGHDPGLYPELTAAENLRFFAALHGVADPEARVPRGSFGHA